LITIQRRFGGDGRSNPRDGRIRADIEFIRSNPVCGDGLLGGFQVELPAANQLVKLSFEPVFYLGVPRRGPVGLRPEIFDRIGATEFERNQVIDLVIAGTVRRDAIFPVNFAFHFCRNVTHLFSVSGYTEIMNCDLPRMSIHFFAVVGR
jgi:hypothetical protein